MISLEVLPEQPGCYLFKNSVGIVIYVGKAKNLKKRVSSYFSKIIHDAKTEALIKQISDIDYIITNTEEEALILENNLVKKHIPKYNILLKDGKRFAYLVLTNEDYPRVIVSRDIKEDGQKFGPFTSGTERELIYETLVKHFMLRTCNRFPKKPCIRYAIKLCSAPCVNLISKEEYSKTVKEVTQVLSGNIDSLIRELKENMIKYSENMEFEKAKTEKDKILALEHLKLRQNVERNKEYNEDVIYYYANKDNSYILIFNVYKGTLINKQEFMFDYTKEDFLEEFLLQFYENNKVPKEVIINEKVSDAISGYLKTRFIIPKIGEKKVLLELAKQNLDNTFFRGLNKVNELKETLGLDKSPLTIECFDISHLSGTSTVGSMVQFKNGKPFKAGYRKFKIKSVEGIDDCSSIAEVVRRRYSRLIKEKAELPDLIILDGGIAQLNAGVKELVNLGLRIPIISIAKKNEEIFMPNQSLPIIISKKDPALHLVQEIRDEAHRFAIKYNRTLRHKEDFN